MNHSSDDKNQDGESGVTRRQFLQVSKDVALGTVVASTLSGVLWLDNAVAAIPVSEGYLLVDTKKCQGCLSCMLACSLVHEGVESLSLSRIQVIQDSFETWPDDLTIEQCRQCVDAPCVDACPVNALEPDPEYGHVRRVDDAKCLGCGSCARACPHVPSRSAVAPDGSSNGDLKSRKCDLCATAPYHWDEAGGGPQGKQACVEVCPLGAIQFTTETPKQRGDDGYKVDLRDRNWGRLGYPTR